MSVCTTDRPRRCLLAGGALAALLSGCAEGPIPETKVLNPWVRKQWAEDEQRVTTYHRKVADLAELRKQAASMPPAEREDTAAHLAARLREESSAALRTEFVRTLAEFPTPLAQHAIASSLTDESPKVRTVACQALARRPTAEGFQALSRTVTDDADLDVRIVAARELANFKEFAAAQALRPALAKAKGLIINQSSMASFAPGTAYGVTKAALNAVTYGMAMQFAKDEIRAVAIAPGLMDTEANRSHLAAETQARIKGMQLMKRQGTAEDIANMAVFLASPEGSFVNNQVILVDGGNNLRGFR